MVIHFFMFFDTVIPPPFLFNPLKHHLGYIKEYISRAQNSNKRIDTLSFIRDLKHIGVSLTDIYTGKASMEGIFEEIMKFLESGNLTGKNSFGKWAGTHSKDYKTITLSDNSVWVLKYFNNEQRFVHPFPARNSPHSLRAKANTLKSAVLYLVLKDKDFITETDLNDARAVYGLSPVKDMDDAETIYELIEVLRA